MWIGFQVGCLLNQLNSILKGFLSICLYLWSEQKKPDIELQVKRVFVVVYLSILKSKYWMNKIAYISTNNDDFVVESFLLFLSIKSSNVFCLCVINIIWLMMMVTKNVCVCVCWWKRTLIEYICWRLSRTSWKSKTWIYNMLFQSKYRYV